MGMEHRLEPRLEQRLKLSPRIIQSIEILQLPLLALEQRVEQELVENPVLELREEGVEPTEEEEPDREPSAEEEEPETSEAEPVDELDEPTEEETEFEKLEELVSDWEDFYSQTRSARPSDETDPKQEALLNTVTRPPSLDQYLLLQLSLIELSDQVRELAVEIIYALDEQGYLSVPLEEIVAWRLPPDADEHEGSEELLQVADTALKVVQSLDPAGVGARDLGECLLLQVTDEMEDADFLRELITNHLEDLLQNRLPIVARATGRSVDDINEAVKVLGQLNPKPASLFTSEVVPYVVPDLSVRYQDGRYRVVLNEGGVPGLYIRNDYRKLLRQANTDPKLREYIKQKVRSAQWLMDAIVQRRDTLTRIAQAIVDRQVKFIDKPDAPLRPLKMQEVADEVGVHVATVSRAVSGKYLDTPHGIYELRRFFTGATTTADGNEESWNTVKRRIVEVIEQEDKFSPLSDQEVADRLKQEGYDVARRTVTKYRKELRIPTARLRRQYSSSNST